MTDSLDTMIAKLLHPWPLTVQWAGRVVDCTPGCEADKLALTIGELRHHECSCPSRIEYRETTVTQDPVITQLCEAKWAAPVTGAAMRGSAKLHPPLPGNLETPDALISNLSIAAQRVLADRAQHLIVMMARKGGKESGAAYLYLIEQVLHHWNVSEREDAQALIAPPYQSAMRYLGYDTGRIMLDLMVCGDCGGGLSVERSAPREVRCEGTPDTEPCGRVYLPAEWLALHEAAPGLRNAEKTHCPRLHEYDELNTRVTAGGKRKCRQCHRDQQKARRVKLAELGHDSMLGSRGIPDE